MPRPTCRTLSTIDQISNTGLSPTMVKLPSLFFYLNNYHVQAPPRSLATTCGITFVFSSCGYLDVSVPRVRLQTCWICNLQLHGLPHSETPGSKIICIYPGLIAAYRVLLRLREPRHPPCALIHFLHASAHSHIPALRLTCALCDDSIYYLSLCQRTLPCLSRHGRVESIGVEPMTPCLQSRCSSQLS